MKCVMGSIGSVRAIVAGDHQRCGVRCFCCVQLDRSIDDGYSYIALTLMLTLLIGALSLNYFYRCMKHSLTKHVLDA